MEKILINNEIYKLREGVLYSLILNTSENPLRRIAKDNPQSWNTEKNLVLESSLFMYMRKKVSKVLLGYGFTFSEINEILNILNISEDIYIYKLSTKIRCHIIIYILLKNNNLILFQTVGISYETIQTCYQLLYEKIQETNKIVIMIEHSNIDGTFCLKEIDQAEINNYSTWIRQLV